MKISFKKVIKLSILLLLGVGSSLAFAADSGNISSIADTVVKQANSIAQLLSVTAYVAGVGFALAGVLQFKAHKENPQQVPLSKPVVMIVVAACLLFLPTILTVAGASLFGSGANSAATAGGGKELSGS